MHIILPHRQYFNQYHPSLLIWCTEQVTGNVDHRPRNKSRIGILGRRDQLSTRYLMPKSLLRPLRHWTLSSSDVYYLSMESRSEVAIFVLTNINPLKMTRLRVRCTHRTTFRKYTSLPSNIIFPRSGLKWRRYWYILWDKTPLFGQKRGWFWRFVLSALR